MRSVAPIPAVQFSGSEIFNLRLRLFQIVEEKRYPQTALGGFEVFEKQLVRDDELLRIGIETMLNLILKDVGSRIIKTGLQAEKFANGVGILATVQSAIAGGNRKGIVQGNLIDEF